MIKLFYFGFSLCYCLIFGEIFVRIFDPAVLMPRYVTAAPYGVRMNVPNAQYWQITPETKVHVRINAQGIRSDQTYSYKKPSGQCRILLFGDSFFVGYEVDLTDSFAYLLEQQLQREGFPCQVINLAVSGFGTAEMLITLKEEGLKYEPDIVIFQWHGTDFTDNVRSGLFKLDKEGQLVRAKASYLPAVKIRDWLSQFIVYRWLIENSQFYSAIRESAAGKVKAFLAAMRKPTTEKTQNDAKDDAKSAEKPQKGYALRLSTGLLQEAKRLTNANHAHFIVVEIPGRRSRTQFSSRISQFDANIREQLNMWTPIAFFRQAADPERKIYFEKGHFHLTPWGNQLLIEYFWPEFKQRDWLNFNGE